MRSSTPSCRTGRRVELGQALRRARVGQGGERRVLAAHGEVVEVNDTLQDEPQRVNEDCYGEGWLVRVRMTAPGELGELMDADAYKKFLDEA